MNYSNKAIAAKLKELAQYSNLDNQNPFKIRAYEEAASIIEKLPFNIENMVKNREDLKKIPHIGPKIEEKIYQLINQGEITALKKLKEKYPSSLLEILSIPGLGAKKVIQLYKELGITSLKELQEAINEKRVSNLKGFGEKLIKHIKDGIIMLKQEGKRFLYIEVKEIANELIEYMESNSLIKKVIIAGSFRRKKETVGDLDLVVVCKKENAIEVIKFFIQFPKIKEIINKGDNKSTIILNNNLQVDLRVANSATYGSTLNYFTGSKAHTLHLRKYAKSRGWKINEYGIFNEKEENLASKSEKAFYKALGMDYIEPELREDRGEIEAALKHTLPKLIKKSDIKGDLHIHTTFSDGVVNIETMVQAAYKKGYKYIAITDHSKHIPLLNGMDEEKLLIQSQIIDNLNKKYKNFKILKGIEVDILKDGSLAISNETLSKLDIVVASIHDYFSLTKKEQTNRLIKAINNPYVNIIGHISGRLIQKRPAYEIDYEKIFEEAIKNRVAIEINSQPRRLDINDIYAKIAKERGVKFAINSDAHHIRCLDYMELGINQARRGWVEKENVINTLSLKKLKKFLEKK